MKISAHILKKTGILLFLFILIAVLVNARLLRRDNSVNSSQKLAVTVTFSPLAELAKQVGGDLIEVRTLVPTGSEPHDFEPTPQNMVDLYRSRVFIYNGAGLETWVDEILPELTAKQVDIVDTSRGINLIETGSTVQKTTDPHIWLNPVLAQQQVKNILTALMEADPVNAERYRQNGELFLKKLNDLDSEFKSGLGQCKKHIVISTHQALNYLSREYGFKVLAIAGISPDQQPSSYQLSKLTEFARANQIRYILFESLVSPKVAQTLADEVGASSLTFNTLEGVGVDDQTVSYLELQRQNLQTLKLAMECQ